MRSIVEAVAFFLIVALRTAAGWLASNARPVLFVLSLAGLSYGLSLVSEPLAIIVPSSIILAGLIITEILPAGGRDA